jgi:hypothetical protein
MSHLKIKIPNKIMREKPANATIIHSWERHGMCELTVALNTRLSGRHRFLEARGNYSHVLGLQGAR